MAIILPITVPLQLISAVYTYHAPESSGINASDITFAILELIAYSIYMVAVIAYLASLISGETINIKQAWRVGLNNWVKYFFLCVYFGIMVSLGMLLFILPGIYLFIRFSFCEFELIINKRPVFDCFGLSWKKTRPYIWQLLFGFAALFVIVFAPFILLDYLTDQIEGILAWVIYVISNLAYSVVSILFTIYVFRIYTLEPEETNTN